MHIKLGEEGMVSTLPGKLVSNKGKAGNVKGQNEGTKKDIKERGSRHKSDWQKLGWFFVLITASADGGGVVKKRKEKEEGKKKKKRI